MKIFAVSDLHLSINNPKPMDIFKGWDNYIERIISDWKQRVNDGDIVLLPGDFSWAMDLKGAIPDLEFLSDLPGHKILLRGNHDYWWSSISKVRQVLPPKIYAVQNDALKIDNIIIFGTRGWTADAREPDDIKIYNREIERLKLSIAAMEKIRETDNKTICMTHYPPFNVNRDNSRFTDILTPLKIDAVVYGHLHGKDCRKDLLVYKGSTPYYLTSCDLTGHKLVEINIIRN